MSKENEEACRDNWTNKEWSELISRIEKKLEIAEGNLKTRTFEFNKASDETVRWIDKFNKQFESIDAADRMVDLVTKEKRAIVDELITSQRMVRNLLNSIYK